MEEDFYDEGGVVCPKCMGDRTVDCYCGGDLCFCENYGERDCPVCHGEGEVSEAREETYFESQRRMHAAFQSAMRQSDEKIDD
ncbi:hypothetical protein [Brevundimonas sp.]